ncbi:ProQ/FINO family protein [Pararoseomonas sp. SCSIO 73927]|uniref:ProQ/FINO family protein n=1 Tax=Pararoseomonas sp. SCSIO 73927 TaxID=3114537 RepID=UPI0030D2FB30
MRRRFYNTWRADRARLAAVYPAAFPGRNQDRPALSRGIRDQLVATGMMTRRQAGDFLSEWTRRPRYLQAIVQGGRRVHLDGRPAEHITEGDQRYAARALEQLRYVGHVSRRPRQPGATMEAAHV